MSLSERVGFAPAPPTDAVALRVGLYLAVAVWAALVDVGGLVESVTVHWDPRSVLRLLPGPPDRAVVEVARALLVLATVASAVGILGWVPRSLAAVTGVFLMALHDAAFGGLSHNYALVAILLVALVPAPLTAWASVDARRRATRADAPPWRSARWAWPVGLARTVVVVVYLSAGLAKLRDTGLGWLDPDSFQRWAWVKLDRMADPSTLGLVVARDDTLAFVAAAGVLIIQLAVPLALVWPRTRPLIVAGILMFHALSWATLDLDFWLMAVVAVLPLVAWESLRRRLDLAPPQLSSAL